MAGLDTRKSDVSDLRSRLIARKSGTPDFRCHPRLSLRVCRKTWMAGTRPAMTWRGHSVTRSVRYPERMSDPLHEGNACCTEDVRSDSTMSSVCQAKAADI